MRRASARAAVAAASAVSVANRASSAEARSRAAAAAPSSAACWSRWRSSPAPPSPSAAPPRSRSRGGGVGRAPLLLRRRRELREAQRLLRRLRAHRHLAGALHLRPPLGLRLLQAPPQLRRAELREVRRLGSAATATTAAADLQLAPLEAVDAPHRSCTRRLLFRPHRGARFVRVDRHAQRRVVLRRRLRRCQAAVGRRGGGAVAGGGSDGAPARPPARRTASERRWSR